MEKLNFDITKFDERKAELYQLGENCKNVVINGINDKKGYELADESRKILKKKRCDLQKEFKQERAVSNAYSKAVIALEKEVVGIIEPIERDIENKQKAIDLQKEMIKREELLPERMEKLENIGIKEEKAYILSLDNKAFEEYYNMEYSEFLAEKERKIKEQEEKLKRDKEIADAKEQARIDAEKKAEQKRKDDIELIKKQAELDKQKLIDDQKRKDDQRIADEKEKKRLADEKIANEKAEQEKLEKRKKYTNWLEKHGYTEKTKDEFYITNQDNKFTIYKKLSEITIK